MTRRALDFSKINAAALRRCQRSVHGGCRAENVSAASMSP